MNIQEQPKDKKDEIIIVAQKRFGLFGHKKTSMLEIANDLNMSKALLYYYFPDKEHLYNAVVEKEIGEFKVNVTKQLKTIDDPSEKLRKYVRLRLIHFRTLLNLGRFRMEEFKRFSTVMNITLKAIHKFEIELIIEILKEGNKKAQFYINSPEETAGLLFDLLRGMRIVTMKDKQLFYLDEHDYKTLAKKTETFMDIFIQGLTNKNNK